MARGKSGRVVIETDPNLKRNLYFALELHQLTLKEWFEGQAHHFLSESNQSGDEPLNAAQKAWERDP